MGMKICSWHRTTLEELIIPDELIRGLRRADGYIQLAVCSGFEVMKKCSHDLSDSHDTGIVAGSAFGPFTTNFEILDQLVENEPSSPTLFSHSVFNAAVGYMASSLRVYGTAMTLTEIEFPFYRALEQASTVLAGGLSKYVLVLQVESYADILRDVNPDEEEWKAGAVCWLLTNDDALQGVPFCLKALDANNSSRRGFLQFDETLVIDGMKKDMSQPLQSAMELTEMLDTFDGTMKRVEIETPYGKVELQFG